jgi:hypothetical protein
MGMKVKELIEKLQQFSPELEVQLNDGFEFQVHRGEFSFNLYNDLYDGKTYLDIGFNND